MRCCAVALLSAFNVSCRLRVASCCMANTTQCFSVPLLHSATFCDCLACAPTPLQPPALAGARNAPGFAGREAELRLAGVPSKQHCKLAARRQRPLQILRQRQQAVPLALHCLAQCGGGSLRTSSTAVAAGPLDAAGLPRLILIRWGSRACSGCWAPSGATPSYCWACCASWPCGSRCAAAAAGHHLGLLVCVQLQVVGGPPLPHAWLDLLVGVQLDRGGKRPASLHLPTGKTERKMDLSRQAGSMPVQAETGEGKSRRHTGESGYQHKQLEIACTSVAMPTPAFAARLLVSLLPDLVPNPCSHLYPIQQAAN